MVTRVVVAVVLLAAVGVAAWLLRRKPSDAPPRDVYAVPRQLDRADFPRPDAPWLVALGVKGDIVAVALMLLGTQWYILFNVVAGAAAIPGDLSEVAAVFGLRRLSRFVILYLGGIFPFLLTGVITAAGGAWNASIVSESVHYGGGEMTVEGIGSLIARSFDTGRDSVLAASTTMLAIALVLVNRFVWRRLYRVADDRFAMNR